ncbi:anaphase-promoting complex, cyclosome, subunit 4-domain-containing protein [Lasiosphaeris hirsuta]|uniref:Anaphase-promoting complex subunit 4 n=1 Tax=Lasiosphaeris hirsuta TaxID=260670 RepID=A0AA40A8V7_9PEZI|nr:anaphase-promoting complex, cyclosome, subunit 4-domain-containing protein [Lasiosphaeris hirsuta]
MVHNGELSLFSSSKLSMHVSGRHLASNPVIDLTATVGDGGSVLCIWRANDQLVSKHTERNQKAEALKWKEDGQFLAAGWSDGVVRLVGLESSKAVHHIRVCDGASVKIDFIGWSRNVTGRTPARRTSSSKLQSWEICLDDKKDIRDLPHELTFLEAETALPKISPLPVSGGSGDDMFVFSTTSSLEFVFRPIRPEDADAVHVMIVGTTDGGIHLSIYDSFVIGSFKYAPRTTAASSGPGVFQLCGHGSHPEISTHVLLLRPQGGDLTSLYVTPMDLTFVHYSPVNLSLLASKMTTMQNLLRYMKQTQSHMTSEWKSTRELPARFLNAVKEDLEKMPKGPVTIVQALYHTVVTGHVFPPLKEWLVDSLAERGHKRWDKAVVSGLENLRSLIHENFLPALERCGIILSRLLGIARFHDSRESIGFTSAQISKLMDIVSCLTVVAHKVLLCVMDELDHFTAFSVWLRMEIDKQASSTINEDLTEKEANMDNAKVLAYIQRYLVSSPLALYFDEVTKEDYAKDQELTEAGPSLLELLDKQLKRQEAGQPFMRALPHIDFLVNYLTNRANTVFQDIAEAEKRSVRFGQAVEVSIGQKIWKQDLHMCSVGKKDDSQARVFTVIASESDKRKLYLFRTVIPIINGISGSPATCACSLSLPKDAAIIDFKFLNDTVLLVLCHCKDRPPLTLLRIEYRSKLMPYSDYRKDQSLQNLELEPLVGKTKMYLSFEFSRIGSFTPIQMEVQNASTARGNIPARICLLGRDKVGYKNYALSEGWETAEVEQELENMEIAMEGRA